MSNFVHLHNHTHYSLLDAAATPEELVKAAAENSQPAVALTDHGVMFGTVEFYNMAKKYNVKPLLGMEAYIANGSRFDKNADRKSPGGKKRNYFHILFIAKNNVGYRNLMKLTSYAHTEGFYYRPRIDKELLEKYHEGLICSTACMGSMVNAHIIDGDYERAYSEAKYYKDLFGDDFYIELQNHNLENDPIILEKAPKIAGELGIKMICSNDIHYLKPNHAYAHNVLLNIRDASGTDKIDLLKLRYGTPEYYFKSTEQMIDLFGKYPGAIENTLEIADKCDVKLDTKTIMPDFPIPAESKSENLEEYLKELTYKGLYTKYDNVTDEIIERVEYELGVINSMGFPGYFLIVWDFIDAAKRLGCSVGPGRGSAVGSIVAYCLGITNIDPLPYDLLFERFLNPERYTMPDIDIDFNDEKRELVINYVKYKYGEEAVAQIITFGKLSSKAVLTDVGRVLGIELNTIKNITKKIPVEQGKVKPLKDAILLPDLKWVSESNDDRIKELINYSLLLEGKFRHTGIHAAGVVITPGDITDYVPVYQSPSKGKDGPSEIATQYSMGDLESIGLLKMDFLGLRTLSIIDNTLEMIQRNHNKKIDIDKIDFLDKKTYDLISNGETLGIFQFESGGMQEYLKQLKPHNLEELTAMNALYRPGPMANIPDFIDRKHGRKPVEYLHPLMEKPLKATYGIIVYQEQVMQLVQIIGDFTLGQADILRRAMGKKKESEMDKMKPAFIEGAAKKGISEKLALEIFDLIYKFANYGFNKSHSVAYSYIAFQTAWLKTYYPAEFLAANMTAELNSQEKIVRLVYEAKKYGLKVYPPDVNRSFAKFTAEGDTIYFGLAGIKNVGIAAVDSIVEIRESKPFKSFFDFIARVNSHLVNKRTLEALVLSGAFDLIENGKRRALFESIDVALNFGKKMQGDDSSFTDSLFLGEVDDSIISEPSVPDVTEWDERERLEREKEILNFYVSGHPLNEYSPFVRSFSNIDLTLSVDDAPSEIKICGMLSELRIRRDKKENEIAFCFVEDFSGKAELLIWSDTYSKFKHLIKEDAIVYVSGKLSEKDDVIKIVVNDIQPVDNLINSGIKGYKLWINLDENDLSNLETVKKDLLNSNGKTVRLKCYVSSKDKTVKKTYYSMDANLPLDMHTTQMLCKLFGNHRVQFEL
ncbi:MAG: DNA polymerase III subunit alpha [Candidatus Kapabacteria bacterium]|nr:DNA polymerase III subunit alpha [Ignavibacteriota bacterium]MCW5884541.1 DNA polymerase III subunit alpha [Candidatus Kapabacteria bacterium]